MGAGSAEQRRRVMHALQRTAGNATVNRMLRELASPPEVTPGPARLAGAPATSRIDVDDNATPSPGQMRRGEQAAGQNQVAFRLFEGAATADPDPEQIVQRLGPGRSLDTSVRTRMGAALGAGLGAVRVHDDDASAKLTSSLGARAMTVGEHVAFAHNQYEPGTPLGDALIAHELAHVVQQSDGRNVARSVQPGSQLEADADGAAASALQVLHGGAPGRRGLGPALRSGLRLQRCSGKRANPFADYAAITDTVSASKASDAYLSMGAADRRAAVKASYKSGLPSVLSKLAPADQINKYAGALREITRTVEEEETHASSGMTDDQIATTQRDYIKKKAQDAAAAAAAAKAPPGAGPPPVPAPAEVEAERKKQVEAQALPKPAVGGWDALSAADKAAWTTRATNAIAKVVTHATAKHPELGITAANFKIAFKEVEGRGAGVVAMGSPAQIGFAFVTAAEADPAYVMDVVVHEVFGHPGYGPYGSEYHLALYDKAMATMPGYVKPAAGSEDRKTEQDAYGYQETEIYALLRGSAYRTAPKPADVAKVPNLDPKTLVRWHIRLMKDEWAPTLLVPILRGLRMRLVVDPRITGPAMNIFDDSLKAEVDAATASAVTKT